VIFREQPISGVFTVDPEPFVDERGSFARTYSQGEFAEHGLSFTVAETSVSFNTRCGTLRGMHLQVAPHAEAKLVRCVAGAVYDVVVDLRAGSPTQFRWIAVELAADRRTALYVPPGGAHGFMTLRDDCELEYLISTPYVPSAAAGLRWDDPAIGITWPSPPSVISERDLSFPDVDVERVRANGPSGLVPAGGAIP
jgi:dTDP-4-dehydrorhamnose 3,5-epimerase